MSELRELSLFSGVGGGLLASRLLGWTTVQAVELDSYCREILTQRQADGLLDPFPIHDDVRTFHGLPWSGRVDVVSGGFPCQDVSSAAAGRRDAGIDGAKSSLVFEMLRIVGEVRPRWVFAENSPYLRVRGLDRIVERLAGMGYETAWGVLGAGDLGAPHRRRRLWLVAHTYDADERDEPFDEQVGSERAPSGVVCDARARGLASNPDGSRGLLQRGSGRSSREEEALGGFAHVWDPSALEGVDDGLADRVVRARATGNGQVPCVAAAAWEILSGVLAP
jgi:DNA (cytosine-5)-methyltransferase 1